MPNKRPKIQTGVVPQDNDYNALKSAYNSKFKDIILPALARGNTLANACALADIPAATIERHIEVDSDWREQVMRHRALFQDELVESVRVNAKKDGRLALDVLKALAPNEWRPENKQSHAGAINVQINIGESSSIIDLTPESEPNIPNTTNLLN